MLKEKIMRLLNNAKELVMRRKKEVAIAAAGAVVLGGLGFGVYYATSDNTSGSEVVEDTVLTDDSMASETTEDTTGTDKVADNSVSTEETSEGVASTEEGTENIVNEDKEVIVSGNHKSETIENKGNSAVSEKEENKGGSTSSSKPSAESSSNSNSSSKPSKPSTTPSKPSTMPSKPSSSSTTPSKPSAGSSSNSNSPSKPSTAPSKPSTGGSSKPSHTHNWVEQTKQVYHKEQGHYEDVLVKPAWTEEVPVYEERERSICNGCRKDITSNPYKHIEDALMAGNTKCGGFHSEWKKVQVGTKKVHHKAEYKKKWVVDKKAWTETVVTGHKCSSCGVTK